MRWQADQRIKKLTETKVSRDALRRALDTASETPTTVSIDGQEYEVVEVQPSQSPSNEKR